MAYGPKDKFIRRIEQNPDPTPGPPYQDIKFPRMYFEMTNIGYDSSRKTSPIQKYKAVIDNNGSEVKVQYVPVPYNIDFELGILTKNQDDGLQILEQILPYFQPNFNITINFIPEMNENRDVCITLTGVDHTDDWDDSFMQRRLIEWKLNFIAKSYIYGPFNQIDIIRKAIVFESVGTYNQHKRNAKFTYSPKALDDKNNDNIINNLDDALVTSDDDFGFNEQIDLL